MVARNDEDALYGNAGGFMNGFEEFRLRGIVFGFDTEVRKVTREEKEVEVGKRRADFTSILYITLQRIQYNLAVEVLAMLMPIR